MTLFGRPFFCQHFGHILVLWVNIEYHHCNGQESNTVVTFQHNSTPVSTGAYSAFCGKKTCSMVLGAARWGGGTRLLLASSHLTIVHASLSRRSTVPTSNRDTSNIWALITFFSICDMKNFLLHLTHIPFLFRLLWPPSIS